ncbi:hypothetical protein K469DRAFT_571849, partial [Zopfia rhizophila CBS 207.26]
FLESSHQLRCLLALWSHHHLQIYPHLFPMPAEKLRMQPKIEETHFEHSTDVTRQRLVCTADAAILTFRLAKGLSTPYPNFHTGHLHSDY